MLSKFPAGRKIFVDANIFIYHFLGLKDDCTQLLIRVENRQIAGFTSTVVIAEVWHRLMIAEAIENYGLTPHKAVNYLMKIWPLTQKTFVLAQSISHEYGLLTNDALNAALMHRHRVNNIATNDADFLRIKDIKVWRPS